MCMKTKNNNIVLILLLSLLPFSVFAEYASYGNDYLNLLRGPGGELYGSAYGLMQYGSDNTMMNAARLSSEGLKGIYLYHSTWFRSEVSASSAAYTFNLNGRPLGVMFSRIGVEDIPDSRNALLDYGIDGIPGTGDTGEGNGVLDENEIIDYDGVVFRGIANYSLHLGMPIYQKNNWDFGLSLGLLYTGLIESNGFGLTFDLYAEQKGSRIKSLYSIENLPSALMVFSDGSAQYYPPQAKAAWLYPVNLGSITLEPGLSAALAFTENIDYYMFSLGDHIAVDIQPLMRIKYKEVVAAGLSYKAGDGVHVGLELLLEKLDINYSFRPSLGGDLGSSHLISLRISPEILK